MKVKVRITKEFKDAAKPLLKKYPSLRTDLAQLESQLIQDPKLGTSLGRNLYKIRLQIKSKGKGKSGGARVISLLESLIIEKVDVNEGDITVNLITIYDKSDIANISDAELKNLINSFYIKGK